MRNLNLQQMKNHICETSIYNTLNDDILKWNTINSDLYILINFPREERVIWRKRHVWVRLYSSLNVS